MRPISEIEANEYVWDMRPAPIAHSFVGYCKLPQAKRCSLLISYSEGNEMDHVSVSPMNRFTVPTWEDMCALKRYVCAEGDLLLPGGGMLSGASEAERIPARGRRS